MRSVEVLLYAGFAGIVILSYSLYPVRVMLSNIAENVYPPESTLGFLFWVVPIGLYFLFTFGIIKKLRKGGVLAKMTRKLSWLGLKIVNLS